MLDIYDPDPFVVADESQEYVKAIMSKELPFMQRSIGTFLGGICVCGMLISFAHAAISDAKPGLVSTASIDQGRIELAQLFGGKKKRSREAAELNLRVDGVEQEIRNITGKLEELSFQLRQLQDLLRRMQEDNEFRFQELEDSGGSKRGSLKRKNKSASRSSEPNGNHVLGKLPKNFCRPKFGYNQAILERPTGPVGGLKR